MLAFPHLQRFAQGIQYFESLRISIDRVALLIQIKSKVDSSPDAATEFDMTGAASRMTRMLSGVRSEVEELLLFYV